MKHSNLDFAILYSQRPLQLQNIHSNQGHAQSPALKFHPYMVAGAAGITIIHNGNCQFGILQKERNTFDKSTFFIQSKCWNTRGTKGCSAEGHARASSNDASRFQINSTQWVGNASTWTFASIEDDIPFAAALSQAEMVHYYPQYSTPYLVPQQVHSSDHENAPGHCCKSLLD